MPTIILKNAVQMKFEIDGAERSADIIFQGITITFSWNDGSRWSTTVPRGEDRAYVEAFFLSNHPESAGVDVEDVLWHHYTCIDIPIRWWETRNDIQALSCQNTTDPMLPFGDRLLDLRNFMMSSDSASHAEFSDDHEKAKHKSFRESLPTTFSTLQDPDDNFSMIKDLQSTNIAQWLYVRPYMHSMWNYMQHQQNLEHVHCPMGFISIVFVTVETVVQQQQSSISLSMLSSLWYMMIKIWKLSDWIRSGWAQILSHVIISLREKSSLLLDDIPRELFLDCPDFPHGILRPNDMFDSLRNFDSNWDDSRDEWLQTFGMLLSDRNQDGSSRCPMATATVAMRIAAHEAMFGRVESWEAIFSTAQDILWEIPMEQVIFTQWPFWEFLSVQSMVLSETQHMEVCRLSTCKKGWTPNPGSCTCEKIYEPLDADSPRIGDTYSHRSTLTRQHSTHERQNVDEIDSHHRGSEDSDGSTDREGPMFCILMADTRAPTLGADYEKFIEDGRFYAVSYQVNRLYARQHGYQFFFLAPDPEKHYPERKVGWGKVALFIEMMQNRTEGPDRCDYGVCIDTDAYFLTTESLENLVKSHGLVPYGDKLAAFSEELSVPKNEPKVYVNGGFWIVTNSESGVQLIQDWYNVPNDFPQYAAWKKENPQGLNHCWDRAMHPVHNASISLINSLEVSCPRASYVRHNFFKEKHFKQELVEVLFARVFVETGCFWCDATFELFHDSEYEQLEYIIPLLENRGNLPGQY